MILSSYRSPILQRAKDDDRDENYHVGQVKYAVYFNRWVWFRIPFWLFASVRNWQEQQRGRPYGHRRVK